MARLITLPLTSEPFPIDSRDIFPTPSDCTAFLISRFQELDFATVFLTSILLGIPVARTARNGVHSLRGHQARRSLP